MNASELMFAAAPVLVAFALASCGSSTSNNNDAGQNNTCTDMTSSTSPTVGIAKMSGGPYGGYSYAFSPACVRINRGQSVTFTGDYSFHTLEKTTQTVATATNPLPSAPYSGTSPVTFGPFPDAGDFNFTCTIHGFTGTIRVNP
jgi:plastocyanin